MSESESEQELLSNNEESVDKSDLSSDEEDIPENDRLDIREKLSNMSFEDLQKLKNQIGTKLYNKTVFGVDEKKSKPNFKRANKNRPREMSSKKRIRQNTNQIKSNPIKKQLAPRDPRFDSMCGEFDSKAFRDNYKFVKDLRVNEKKQLEKELQQTNDPAQKKKIKFLIQRLGNQIREEEKHDNERKKLIEEKNEVKQQLKSGKKPQFKKKSVKRLENLISKYEELKKSNKLQKHIEKRSKKLKTKDRKMFEKEKLI